MLILLSVQIAYPPYVLSIRSIVSIAESEYTVTRRRDTSFAEFARLSPIFFFPSNFESSNKVMR